MGQWMSRLTPEWTHFLSDNQCFDKASLRRGGTGIGLLSDAQGSQMLIPVALGQEGPLVDAKVAEVAAVV